MTAVKLGTARCAKIKYPTQVDALIALKSMELRANHVEGKVPIRAYQCDDCWRWHLTSREQKFR